MKKQAITHLFGIFMEKMDVFPSFFIKYMLFRDNYNIYLIGEVWPDWIMIKSRQHGDI